MLESAAVDNGLVGVENGIHAHAVGVGAEEVSKVDGLVLIVYLAFKHLDGAVCSHIAGFFHVADGNVGTAHEVDEVAGGLHVLGILGDYPAVEPYGAAFFGNDVIEADANFRGLFNCPYGIAAPVERNDSAVLCHLLLAKIGFPAQDSVLDLLEIRLHGCNRLVGRIPHELLESDASFGEFLLFEIDENGAVDIAGSILDENPACELGVADNVPCAGFLGSDFLGIVKDAGGSPHIGHGIIIRIELGIDLPEHLEHVGRLVQRDVVDGIRDGREVEGKDEPGVEHTLDDIVGRAYHVVVLMAFFDLGEHGLVDVEGLVDDFDVFAGLGLVPLFELGKHRLVYIVGPIVDLENLLTVGGAGYGCGDYGRDGKQFFHFLSEFFV